MEMLLQIIILAAGFFLLVKGADLFVDGAASLAVRLGIPQIIVGLTVVAMGTSAPEAAVSISAALRGDAGITIGNIVGSNIMNVLIILGITALIITVSVKHSLIKIDIPFMIAISGLLLLFGLTGNEITFVEGLILWAVFIGYLIYLYFSAKKNKDEEEHGKQLKPLQIVIFLAAGLAMIILGSNFVVEGAGNIARAIGISERIIGLTIVAFGTSLPELVTSVTAARKGSADLAVGNIVGSNIFNILFIVGTTSLITPVVFAQEFLFDMLAAIAAAVLLWFGTMRRKELRKPLGIVMLIAYAAYFAVILLK